MEELSQAESDAVNENEEMSQVSDEEDEEQKQDAP
jgi:hypothetical protein